MMIDVTVPVGAQYPTSPSQCGYPTDPSPPANSAQRITPRSLVFAIAADVRTRAELGQLARQRLRFEVFECAMSSPARARTKHGDHDRERERPREKHGKSRERGRDKSRERGEKGDRGRESARAGREGGAGDVERAAAREDDTARRRRRDAAPPSPVAAALGALPVSPGRLATAAPGVAADETGIGAPPDPLATAFVARQARLREVQRALAARRTALTGEVRVVGRTVALGLGRCRWRRHTSDARRERTCGTLLPTLVRPRRSPHGAPRWRRSRSRAAVSRLRHSQTRRP